MSGGLYVIFASGPVSHWMLGTLEFKYPPFNRFEEMKDFPAVVVLAGYAVSDEAYPLSSRVNASTAFRLSEAFLIWRSRPDAKLILTGTSEMTGVMGDFLAAMGIRKSALIKAADSQNTSENIRSISPFLEGKRFVLVTSAGHMPRSVLQAKKNRP